MKFETLQTIMPALFINNHYSFRPREHFESNWSNVFLILLVRILLFQKNVETWTTSLVGFGDTRSVP
ncbi:hypothetical protein QQG55_44605 [Brugia pahangi]